MTTEQDILREGLDLYGLKEVPGEDNNPEIMRMFSDIGHSWVQGDETAWCSAAMNWIAYKLGLDMSGSLLARSWLDVGLEVRDPEPGNIVIFWRRQVESQWGHVGIYIKERHGLIYTLGGNQGNEYNISPYPGGRVLGYRKLRPA